MDCQSGVLVGFRLVAMVSGPGCRWEGRAGFHVGVANGCLNRRDTDSLALRSAAPEEERTAATGEQELSRFLVDSR